VSNLIVGFNVSFNEDADPAFNALNRVVRIYGGHSYMLTDTAGAWANAENQAVALGGHLATINDAVENAFVRDHFASATPWIGFNDRTNEGTFTWIGGDPVTYTAWSGSQPDNNANEDFAQMLATGLWNDSASGSLRGLVEVASTSDADNDGLVDTLDRYPSDPLNAFDLRAAGADLAFDTPDDIIYNLDTTGYTSGLTASFDIADGPLQAGNYRLKISSSFRDRLGNALPTPYVKTFTVTGVSGLITENRSNDFVTNATSFSLSPTNSPDGSFSFLRNVGTGVNPHFVISAHFNGDTNLDLAVANYGSDNIGIYLGDGTGAFQLGTNVVTGNGAISLVRGNFNGDANLDLAVANYSANTVSVLFGNGAGGFQLASNYTGFSNPRNLATADFNGDSVLDLAVPNYGGANVSVLLGNGNGTFGPRVNYSVGNNPPTVAAGDLNADGKVDLVVPNYNSDTVSLLYGNGNGTFQTATNIAMPGSSPWYAAIDYLNSDTNLDLVIAGYTDNVISVFAGNPDGTLAPRVTYPTGGSTSYHLLLRDINADGFLDAVVSAYSSSRLITLLNNGNGTLSGSMEYVAGSNPIASTVGDFNNDGRPDIAVANYSSQNLSILLGNQTQVIADDPAGTGLRISAGRGNLSSTADVDYWTFSGLTGDRFFFATENPGNPSSSSLCYTIRRPDGQNLVNFCTDGNGRGDVGVVLPSSKSKAMTPSPRRTQLPWLSALGIKLRQCLAIRIRLWTSSAWAISPRAPPLALGCASLRQARSRLSSAFTTLRALWLPTPPRAARICRSPTALVPMAPSTRAFPARPASSLNTCWTSISPTRCPPSLPPRVGRPKALAYPISSTVSHSIFQKTSLFPLWSTRRTTNCATPDQTQTSARPTTSCTPSPIPPLTPLV
jgi:hypothetical protein